MRVSVVFAARTALDKSKRILRDDRFSYFPFRRRPSDWQDPHQPNLEKLVAGAVWTSHAPVERDDRSSTAMSRVFLKVGKRTLEDKRSSGRQVRADLTELIPIIIETWRLRITVAREGGMLR